MKTNKNSECIEDGYICFNCADAYKGIWPKDHCATVHIGKCPFCLQKKGLAAVDDWNWKPGDRPFSARVGRD